MREARVTTGEGRFNQKITVGPHELLGDELEEVGGTDRGPSPFEYLAVGLGTCTSMTVKLYADRKTWPLEKVDVKVTASVENGELLFTRAITFIGALDQEQRTRLLEIANKCPVHKALSGKIRIETTLAG